MGHGDVDSERGAIADEELNSDSANEAEEDGAEEKAWWIICGWWA